jgi:hypothetical protein
VTLSVTAILQLRRPRLLRGMLPYGVRTFLQRILRFTSDHLPSRSIYHNQRIAKVRINLEARKPGKELGKQEYTKRSDGFLGFLVASFRSVPFFLFS